MISIASLIYQSRRYADALYESLRRHTPMLATGEAQFYFVANDASPPVREHLVAKRYPHFVNENPPRSRDELVAMGIGWPEYIHRVYRGWNAAIRHAPGPIVVLVNSDMMFSPGWLEALLAELTPTRFVCSQLVEQPGGFPGSYGHALGGHPEDFDEARFLQIVEEVRRPGTRGSGAYMPCAFHKDFVAGLGCYPEGNLHSGLWENILRYGDEDLIYRIGNAGGEHVTALDSIVYHFKEGEMRRGED
jgi:hypothetical protein